MAVSRRDWSTTVFRLSGLPSTATTRDDVSYLLSERLGDIPAACIRVFSLATALHVRGPPRFKVATIMFSSLPSLIDSACSSSEWSLLAKPLDVADDFILDIHFMGLTPLNDPENSEHMFDCIAISGLASHPFGSWQPKESTKTFMWIRDELPSALPGARALIYGYDTKLHDSQSFQLIPDLAMAFVTQLETYGWNSSVAKPIAFLSHSLGGLVLKQALVQLASNNAYKKLLGRIEGAVFFGVPNLGMEHQHFHTVVGNNPNQNLVDDLARGSNYLGQLHKAFEDSCITDTIHCFWAYETLQSPTIRRLPDGRIDRNGWPAILVNRESATCRLTQSNPAVTFPINATHSDMVKFTRGSALTDVVISKMSKMLSSLEDEDEDIFRDSATGHTQVSDTVSTPSTPASHGTLSETFKASIIKFKRHTGITEAEEADFKTTSLDQLQTFLRSMQGAQEQSNEGLQNMNRLNSFLTSVIQYTKVTGDFVNPSDFEHFIWGPVKYVLKVVSTLPDAYHSILNAYQDIGELIPCLLTNRQLFTTKPFLREILTLMYDDILDFHSTTIRLLKQRYWKKLFQASWRSKLPEIDCIKQNMRRNRRVFENPTTLGEFEEIQNHRQSAINASEREKAARDDQCQAVVRQWLSAFPCDEEQDRHRNTRSICPDSGRWLLDHPNFQNWFNPDFCQSPLLWLNGLPGAGKTILSSVVVDAVKSVKTSTVGFFFCKYGDKSRNAFINIARSVLGQILAQTPHLSPYFYEQASMSKDAILTSDQTAKEMLQSTLDACTKTYIIIDGLDECGRLEGKKIVSYFQTLIDNLPLEQMDSIRCLLVSQDDAASGIPSIKVTALENKGDLGHFVSAWHKQIEAKFGELQSKENHIANILFARAQGMFIFAELMAKYLEDQPHRASLLEELRPERFPVKLDTVYSRIIQRVFDSRGNNVAMHMRQVLGWIVCAKRPLRWREIQGAICVDVEQQIVNHDKKLLDSPRGLFAALVEMQADGTVELVHGTAREYLVEKGLVQAGDVDFSLSVLCLSYLTLPQFDPRRKDDDIGVDIRNGSHAFYDYASACWAMHLESGLPKAGSEDKLNELRETLETFVESHWSSSAKALPISEKLKCTLAPMSSSDHIPEILQAVAWYRKQTGTSGSGPTEDDALDLWQITERSRATLEQIQTQPFSDSIREMQQFYGPNWFKCPRINCYFYHHGFSTSNQRQLHILKHDRPFLCFVIGCHMASFGCATENDLKGHLFEYHGIDMFDDTEFPDPPKRRISDKPTTNEARFHCEQCPNVYTRRHNLNNHVKSAHSGERSFTCVECGAGFTRNWERQRHEKKHEDKAYTCQGTLKDGSTWGCNKSFTRADILATHLKSRGGTCIRPLMLQRLQEDTQQDEADGENIFINQSGSNSDTLLAAGKLLPSFKDFLQLCGLSQSVSTAEAIS